MSTEELPDPPSLPVESPPPLVAAGEPAPAIPCPRPVTRLVSLDAYRGLIMLSLLCSGVFFKNLSGVEHWGWLAWNNEHVAWDTKFWQEGVTWWDLIQPSFMFMVGVAMPFALAKRTAEGADATRRFLHVLVRAANLMLVGIVLDHMGAEKIQPGIIRVLQQIAIGYVGAFFVVGKSWRVQAITAGAILLGYSLLWLFNPWNGAGGPWAPANENIGSAFDLWARGQNYPGYYVGMNAIPATATIIFGVMAGTLIQKRLPPGRTLLLLAGWGAAALLLGAAVSGWLPLIKRIWTPSWAVFAGGCTALTLAAFYLVIDVWGLRRWAFPLVVVGMNSIAAYCLPSLLKGTWDRVSGVWVKYVNEHCIPWQENSVWRPVFEQGLWVAFAWLVLYYLWRRRIFVKC